MGRNQASARGRIGAYAKWASTADWSAATAPARAASATALERRLIDAYNATADTDERMSLNARIKALNAELRAIEAATRGAYSYSEPVSPRVLLVLREAIATARAIRAVELKHVDDEIAAVAPGIIDRYRSLLLKRERLLAKDSLDADCELFIASMLWPVG